MRWTLLLSLVFACKYTPSWVERPQVDEAMARGDYETVCVGLKMKDPELKQYTAQQLAPVPDPIAEACICEALQGEEGKWDQDVAEGLRGAKRDEAVRCLADLAGKPDLPERDKALSILGRTKAPISRATLVEIAKTPGDAAVRAQAAAALMGDSTQKEALIALLADPEPKVRAAAATSLGGLASTDADVLAALVQAATNDAEAEVRAAALAGARQSKDRAAAALACKMMVEDPAPAVRYAAAQGFRGATDKDDLACLRKRMLTAEDEAAVRQALLDVVKSSPSPEAGKILCDAIPFWVKSYLVKGLPEQIAGTDIIGVQNDRDYEHSYECVQKAVRAGGYSCYGKQYVGFWMRELGGNAPVPKCPPPGSM